MERFPVPPARDPLSLVCLPSHVINSNWLWNPKICLHWSTYCHSGLPLWHPNPQASLLNGVGTVRVVGEYTSSFLVSEATTNPTGNSERKRKF